MKIPLREYVWPIKKHVHTYYVCIPIMVSIVEMRFLLLFLFVFHSLVELVIFPVALEFLTWFLNAS